MARKTTQTITHKQGLAKSEGLWDYMQTEAFRFFPGKDEWRKRLCYSIYEWVYSEDKKGREPIEIQQFCNEYRIPYNTLNRWENQFADIKEALDEARLIIACRRKVGAIHKEYDKEAAWKNMHEYDPKWDAVNKYHAALKKDEVQLANDQRIVIIERFPESDLVPVKKKSEE